MASLAAVVKPEKIIVEPVMAVQIDRETGTDPSEISHAMGGAFELIDEVIEDNHLVVTGPPRAIYTAYGPNGTKFTVAMPIAAEPGVGVSSGPARVGELPGGTAMRFAHRGPYRKLMKTYEGITEWMKEKGLLKSESDWAKYMPMWEEYVEDPEHTAEDELLTFIYVPMGE